MEETLNMNSEILSLKNSDKTNEYIMPDLSAISKVIFATHCIAFIKNIVKSAILAVYKSFRENSEFKSNTIEIVRDIIRDGNIIFETAIKNLNLTWSNYHQKTDSSLKIKIDLMKKNGKFFHNSCLFSYMWNFCQMLLIYTLGRIDLNELRDVEFLSDCIDIITDGILAFHVDSINDREFFCNEKCDIYEYTVNDDFIKIKKKN
jgi:hypothetical protein